MRARLVSRLTRCITTPFISLSLSLFVSVYMCVCVCVSHSISMLMEYYIYVIYVIYLGEASVISGIYIYIYSSPNNHNNPTNPAINNVITHNPLVMYTLITLCMYV